MFVEITTKEQTKQKQTQKNKKTKTKTNKPNKNGSQGWENRCTLKEHKEAICSTLGENSLKRIDRI